MTRLWLRIPDLMLLATRLIVGAFLGGSKLGFWWTVIEAIVTAFFVAAITSLIGMRSASAYLSFHGVPREAQQIEPRLGLGEIRRDFHDDLGDGRDY